MPSSKGKPTDPKLREKVKEEVKNETNKDGGGKGQWSAWKAAKLSKEYEKKGGGYENAPGSKNEPEKGVPKEKSESKKKKEEDEAKQNGEESEDAGSGDGDEAQENGVNGEEKTAKMDKSDAKSNVGRKRGRPPGSKEKKEKKAAPREGTRRSSRVKEQGSGGVKGEDSAPPAKRAKTGQKKQ